jgi:hypothetical protein
MTMRYPQGFIDAVKEAIPNNIDLHKALDAGDIHVGEHLLEAGKIIRQLTSDWMKFVGEHFKQHG